LSSKALFFEIPAFFAIAETLRLSELNTRLPAPKSVTEITW
jgi:hypothetical protein